MYTTSAVEPRARKFKSGNRISNSTGGIEHRSALRRNQDPDAFRSYIKTGRSSYPFLIFVVLNPHSLLHDEAAALLLWNRLQARPGWLEFNSLAGERKQRFQQQIGINSLA